MAGQVIYAPDYGWERQRMGQLGQAALMALMMGMNSVGKAPAASAGVQTAPNQMPAYSPKDAGYGVADWSKGFPPAASQSNMQFSTMANKPMGWDTLRQPMAMGFSPNYSQSPYQNTMWMRSNPLADAVMRIGY